MIRAYMSRWQRKIPGSSLASKVMYRGLFFPDFGKFGLLVVNLHHGLKAIRIKGANEFDLIKEKQLDDSTFQLRDLYEEALKALEADERFQRQTELFEELVD